ncbi:hypothetical protein JWG44_10780 [Leptospira sp. 201903071]|uniref:hypothetical protein n=1 Tax=Leptospira ainazelensis TaxID=2810034 RepID=UPI0019658868|nr:hypothetical protein [Leptospira ainazelensis]MBM9500730.1 hypothetical protein [Leptospira ainazelensis]
MEKVFKKIKLLIWFLILVHNLNCGKLGIDFTSCKEQKDALIEGVCAPGLLSSSQNSAEASQLALDSCLLILLVKQSCKD